MTEQILLAKACNRCKKEYPATKEHFHTTKNTTSGLRGICKLCRNSMMKIYIEKNFEKFKESQYNYYEKNRKKINQKFKNKRIGLPRCYVAQCLKINVKDLTNELYEQQKNLILFKRRLAKENNISINKLNGSN